MPQPDTATRILHATRILFEREGANAVSMRKIAARVGISPMAIYRHFKNRDALLRRICDDSFHEITRHWDAQRQSHDPRTRLLASQRIYLDYALAYPHLFDYAFSARRSDARRYPEDFRAGRSPTANVIHDAVLHAQHHHLLRAGDPWDIAMSLWAHSHGLIALYRAGRFNFDAQRFRAFHEASVHHLLDGLCSKTGTPLSL